ncbi:hypothetical protein ANO14919_101930 [Xylariales sp. No.14919]|nr:hypothetical protein ANO14919_101930 [Xylariales sp. No.14919]
MWIVGGQGGLLSGLKDPKRRPAKWPSGISPFSFPKVPVRVAILGKFSEGHNICYCTTSRCGYVYAGYYATYAVCQF